MRFGHGLIAGSLALVWAAGAPPSQTPEEPPKPKKLGIDPQIVVQPGEPAPQQPQSPKSGVDTDTVVQVEEPAAQTEPGTATNRRYVTRMYISRHPEMCPGDAFKAARLGNHIIEPASKGGGFYLPLRQFSRIFAHAVTLDNPPKLVNNRYPMSFNGLVLILDGPYKIQGTGEFSGSLQSAANSFYVQFKIKDLKINGESCSIIGLIEGDVRGFRFDL